MGDKHDTDNPEQKDSTVDEKRTPDEEETEESTVGRTAIEKSEDDTTGEKTGGQDAGKENDSSESDAGQEAEPDLGGGVARLLGTLYLLDEKSGSDVTGLEARKLYSHVTTGANASEEYATLKNKGFISGEITRQYRIPRRKKDRAKEEFEKRKEELLDRLVKTIQRGVENDTQLARLVWASYHDPYSYEMYLEVVEDELQEAQKTASTLFGNSEFVESGQADKVIGHIDQVLETDELQEELESLCEKDEYLKTLCVLRPEKTVDMIGAEPLDTVPPYGANRILSEVMDIGDADNILRELNLLGIYETANHFDLDVGSVIEANEEEINEWLRVDREVQKSIPEDWDFVSDLRKAASGDYPDEVTQLYQHGIAIPTNDGIVIRNEVKDIRDNVREEIENRLKDTVGTDEVAVMPFPEEDGLCDTEEKVVLSVNGEHSENMNFGRGEDNVLLEKVVLLVSPEEIGFEGESVAETNIEYNAVDEESSIVGDVKSAFSDWAEADHFAVSDAEDTIEERKIEDLSLNEALEKIDELGDVYQEMLYAALKKSSGSTARGRGYYTSDLMWDDVWENIKKWYPDLNRERFDEMAEEIEYIIEKQAGKDLVEHGDFPDRVYQEYEVVLKRKIRERVTDLDNDKKETVQVSQLLPNHALEEVHREKAEALSRIYFSELRDLRPIANEVGLLIKATWITAEGNDNGYQYNSHDAQKDLSLFDELDVDIPEPGEVTEEIESDDFATMAAIEVMLNSDNDLIDRSKVRDSVLYLSKQAWMEFEPPEHLVSPKDRDKLMINPEKYEELDEHVTETKRDLLEEKETLLNLPESTDVLDYRVDFDSENQVYEGELMLAGDTDINVVFAPWILPENKSLLGPRNLVFVTESHSERAFEFLKDHPGDSIVVAVGEDDGSVEVYSRLNKRGFVEELVDEIRREYDIVSEDIQIEGKEAEEESEEEKTQEATEAAEETKGGGPMTLTEELEVEEPMNLLEQLFEANPGTFPSSVNRDEPVVLILDDNRYGETLQILCREVYRMLSAGLPTSAVRGENDTERSLSAQNRIEYIDQRDVGDKELSEELDWDRLRRRLDELYSQGFGFIIFGLEGDSEADYFVDQLEMRTRKQPQVYTLTPRLPEIRTSDKPEDQDKTRAADVEKSGDPRVLKANAVWNFPLSQKEVERVENLFGFDDTFVKCEREYKNTLRRIGSDTIGEGEEARTVAFAVNESPVIEDSTVSNETTYHYFLKAFVVKHIVENRGLSIDQVETEDDSPIADIKDGDVTGIVPDVHIPSEKEVYEVETLYGSGNPINKIKRKVEQYEKGNIDEKLNVVLTGVAAVLYNKQLIRLKEDIESDWNTEMEYLIPHLTGLNLITLESFHEEMRRP